ncbi:hypothetical protein AVHM3334_01740 [Acidovorax sp. SUPP3334]|nr:hypothetical protein [Acidovorax sp. SUPP3334]GKT20622.1 hypothetical protein AVHM3334_01740 [Acidovorax sp. SUPP3334]
MNNTLSASTPMPPMIPKTVYKAPQDSRDVFRLDRCRRKPSKIRKGFQYVVAEHALCVRGAIGFLLRPERFNVGSQHQGKGSVLSLLQRRDRHGLSHTFRLALDLPLQHRILSRADQRLQLRSLAPGLRESEAVLRFRRAVTPDGETRTLAAACPIEDPFCNSAMGELALADLQATAAWTHSAVGQRLPRLQA